MRAVISSTALAAAVAAANRAVRSAGALGGWMEFTSRDEALDVSVSTAEYSVTFEFAAHDCEPGAAVCMAKTAAALLDAVPPQLLTVTTQDSALAISGDTVDLHVPLHAGPVFSSAQIENPENFEVGARELASGLSEAMPFTAREESRPSLTGILFDLQQDWLTLAASDGHRVIEHRIHARGAPTARYIIPAKAAEEIARSFVGARDDVRARVVVSATGLYITGGMARIQTRLIDGAFINYERLFEPRNETGVVRVQAETLLGALAAPLAVAQLSDRVLTVDLFPDKLRIGAVSKESGDASVECHATYGGSPLRFAVIGDFLRDVCLRGAVLNLHIAGPTGHIIVTREASDTYRAALFVVKLAGSATLPLTD